MKRLPLRITLHDPVIFSESAATAGEHSGLDHVPGSALLGAAATLYARLEPEEQFLVFHSGRVRFRNARVCVAGLPARPMPLALHRAKVRAEAGPETKAYNQCFPEESGSGAQLKQLRAGYLDADNGVHRPLQTLHVKTAIDPETGRADEGRLFTYQALAGGTVLAGAIDADDVVPDELLQQVAQALAGERLLGRSRSAEFGRVEIATAAVETVPPAAPIGAGHHTMLLLADLAPCDLDGFPAADLDLAALGLTGCVLDPDRPSFLRTRRYSSWNTARRGYGRERVVITAGSVINFLAAQPVDPGALACGLGLYREQGLGQVELDPDCLRQPRLVLHDGGAAAGQAETARPDDPLLAWLIAAYQGRDPALHDRVAELCEQYEKMDKRARQLAGIRSGQPYGPSVSQWGRIFAAARASSDPVQLRASIIDQENGIARWKTEGWSDPVNARGATYADWLQEQLPLLAPEGAQLDMAQVHLVRFLSRRVMDLLRGRSNHA